MFCPVLRYYVNNIREAKFREVVSLSVGGEPLSFCVHIAIVKRIESVA